MEPERETAALERLVREHLPGVLRFAVRLTGDLDAAEELVQESLTKAAHGWRSFRGTASFRTWLWRIVVNTFRDQLRRPRRCEPLEADLADPRAGEPGDRLAAEEFATYVGRCVSSLPPRQREVVVLVCYEELSPRNVAQMLSITEANVHVTLHAARGRLRELLAAYDAEHAVRPDE